MSAQLSVENVASIGRRIAFKRLLIPTKLVIYAPMELSSCVKAVSQIILFQSISKVSGRALLFRPTVLILHARTLLGSPAFSDHFASAFRT